MQDPLVRFLRGLRRLSGASSAAIYVPGPFRAASSSVVVSDGSLPPGFELFNLTSARAFRRNADDTLGGAGGDEPVESAVPLAFLLPLRPRQPLWALAGVEVPGMEPAEHGVERAADRDDARRERRSVAWLGLCFEKAAAFEAAKALAAGVPQEPDSEAARLWPLLVELGGGLAGASSLVGALLRDAITGLPDRNVFRIVLGEALASARARGRPLSLLLMNPDNFAAVNAALGRDRGDEIVAELAARLRACLRGADFAARYGGVVFAVLLLDTSSAAALGVARKLREKLAETPYGGGAVKLAASVGVASYEPDDQGVRSALELTRRADRALLAAKSFGGGDVEEWRPEWDSDGDDSFDRLATVFTGDIRRDYRNMALLWETSAALAGAERVDQLADVVLRHIVSAFHLEAIAVFAAADRDEPRLVHGVAVGRGEEPHALQPGDIAAEDLGLVRESLDSGAAAESPHHRRAVILRAGARRVGCLWVAAGRELDATDLALVESIGRHLMLAVERRRLEEQALRDEERARHRLEEELEELRETIAASKLVYRSPSMSELLQRAARVARTEATILITGESGTGKELLAREVHRLSGRSEGPFVVVDCGAISPTLIESELFGHERGAFTGAQRREPGRLSQADGGTVLLDEVTELPLASQVKLLRFVQEKQFVPVGGTQARAVDTRILAATNRDLRQAIAAGSFREDLYYRLNVVRLEIPPLRTRRGDVLLLARRFLRNYGRLHDRPETQYSSRAEMELLAHDWPGNVRELQNRVQQAVILCQGDEIEPEDLGLGAAVARTAGPAAPAARAAPSEREVPGDPPRPVDPWPACAVELGELFGSLIDGGADPMPLGRWLAEEVVLAANTAARGVVALGARLTGLPESTFRRRREAAAAEERTGLRARPASWARARRALDGLIDSGSVPDQLDRRLRELAEGEIARRTGDDERGAAAWMGVTPTTWRRRRAARGRRRRQ